jgi:FMN-dependent NADH-azoreductase
MFKDLLKIQKSVYQGEAVSLFRVDTSIRTEGSVTREVADSFEQAWHENHPGSGVVRRDLGAEPISGELWATAALAGRTPADQRTAEQVQALAKTSALLDQLVEADAVLVTAPLYNFGVAPNLKLWIDTLITDPRIGPPGVDGVLKDKPLVLVIARGGGYGAGTPREGWDHGTPWLLRIFGDVFGMDVHVIEAELTLAHVNPAMEALRDKADQNRADANEAAREHALNLADEIKSLASAAA